MTKLLVCLLVVGCVATVPEPRPPRTVCDASAVPAGAYVLANSTCYHLPADRCYDDDSEECRAEARERWRQNARARRNGVVWLVAISVVGLAAVALTAAFAPPEQ